MTPALTRADLSAIDIDKLGPDSPLRGLIKQVMRKPRSDVEHQQQVKLFAWARENEERHPLLHWLFAVPNWFGVKTQIQGARARAEGRKPGVLDVWFPLQRPGYVGLVIEMKAGKNTLTKDQKRWRAHLERQGWLVVVCFTFEEARDTVLGYINGAFTVTITTSG